MPQQDDLDLLEYRSLVSVYEQARSEDPGDIAVLYWLGHAYTRLGRIADGLEVDLELTSLLPEDATARYNLACSYALLHRSKEALDAIEEAIRLGYREVEHMKADADLASLRANARFRQILADLEEPPAQTP